MMMPRLVCVAALQLVFAYQIAAAAPSNLRVAVAKVDITPPVGTPVVGHVREVRGVRDPLHAVLLLLDDGRTKAAIVTLDLLNAGDEMTARLRKVVNEGAGVATDHVMIATSHNHSGPGWSQNEAWASKVERDLGAAAK